MPVASTIAGKKLSVALQEHEDIRKKTFLRTLYCSGIVGALSAGAGYLIGRKIQRPITATAVAAVLGAGATFFGLNSAGEVKKTRSQQNLLIKCKTLFDAEDPVLEIKAIQDNFNKLKSANPQNDYKKFASVISKIEEVIRQENI